jgi:hypothetical protein
MALVDCHIFEAIAERYRGSLPFLPNLRRLEWDGDAAVYSYISLFLGPQLAHLTFCALNYEGSPSADGVLSIKLKCPFIRKLRVHYAYKAERPDLLASVSDLVGHAASLEDIYCAFPLAPATIVNLSRHPTLKTMRLFDHPLAIVRSLTDADGGFISAPPPFFNLTSAEFESWDGQSTVQLIKAFKTSTHLHVLTIRSNEPVAFTEDHNYTSLSTYYPSLFRDYHPSSISDLGFSDLFSAICSSFPHLRSLRIHIWPPRRHPPNSPPAVFRPLYPLRSLTSLDLSAIRGFELDDEVINDMGSAWPSLRHLVMNNRHLLRPKLTLRGLAHLLHSCSRLKTLWISISVFVHDLSILKTDPPKPNRDIRDLDLGYSTAEEGVSADELGGVLKGLCPGLYYFHVVPKVGSREAWNFDVHGVE